MPYPNGIFLDINKLNTSIFERTFARMLFKNTAKVCLIMISYRFTNLAYRQFRIMKKKLTGFIDPQINNIFGWSTVVYLAENFREVAGTVIHTAGD